MQTLTMDAPALSLTCRACGLTWQVPPRADGTMPRGSRCPAAAGGCGTFHAVPRGRPGISLAAADRGTQAAWDPPSVPRQPRQVAERCPDCGGALHASARGTTRGCLACRRMVIPAAVAAPYQGDGAPRAVRSRHDRDADARDLARARGDLLAVIRQIRESPRLHPADIEVADWYATEARSAATRGRLAELAAELAAEPWRTRHWWQPAPDSEPGGYDDQDDDDSDIPARPLAIDAPPAAPPQPPPAARPEPPPIADWLARHRVVITPGPGCPVTRIGSGPYQRCGQPGGYRWHAETMASPARGTIGVCRQHHAMLTMAQPVWEAAS